MGSEFGVQNSGIVISKSLFNFGDVISPLGTLIHDTCVLQRKTVSLAFNPSPSM